MVGFTVAALGGQLRWRSETGPVVGDLSIPKGLQHFRSTDHPYEHTFTMCCDVPHHVLSRLEADRGGAPPMFWLDLAGSWALDGSMQPIYQRPWPFEVPTDMWLAFSLRVSPSTAPFGSEGAIHGVTAASSLSPSRGSRARRRRPSGSRG